MRQPEFRLADYRKATRSDNSPPDCVHCARGLGWVFVRDTKQQFGSEGDHKLGFLSGDFDAFQHAVRAANLRTALIPAGALDSCCISIERVAKDVNIFRSTVAQPGLPAGAALVFTDTEIEAFLDGVLKGEFDADGDYIACGTECAAGCELPRHIALAAAA